MNVTPNADSQRRWQDDGAEVLRYEYDLASDDIVIDVGAYRGEWADEIHRRYHCRLIVIDPTPSIVGYPHGTVINEAAATYTGSMRFGGAYYYTSAYESPTHELPCFDIAPLLRLHEEIALLKINVEGAEYTLLRYIIEAGLMSRIRNLQIQFHEIIGEPYMQWYDALVTSLKQTHRPTYLYPFCWENWERC